MKKRIDVLLVEKGLFETRQKAKYAIENECVYIENNLVNKVSKIYEEDCNIEIRKKALPFVSRGGLKLDKAIKEFKISIKNKICMDIGASTGGFTDCMLQNGAAKVYAVDVGHNQLDKTLKQNKRVINLEGTNIKEINTEEFEKIEFISIDVSFISLTNVLDTAYKILNQNGEIVILIKPQFEAGKEFINKNGVVKDKKIHERTIEKVLLYANSLGFTVNNIDYSPIKGSAGNIEYIAYIKKQASKLDLFSLRDTIKSIVEKSHKELK